MYFLIAALVALLIVAGLFYAGALPTLAKTDDRSAMEELRLLLKARNDGTLSPEEFERQQLALLTNAAPQQENRLSLKLVVIIVCGLIGLASVATYVTFDKQSPPEQLQAVKNPTLSLLKKGLEGTPDTKPSNGGDLGAMAKRLAKKMEADPSNGEGWLLLARTYLELRQHADAADAFAKATPLLAPDANTFADWADAYVVAHDRKWDDTSRGIVKKALATDPKHLKSLALAGSEAFAREDYKAAISHWKKMKAVAPADSMDAKLADANIEEASALMNGGKPETAAAKPKAGSANRIDGTVSISPSLKGYVEPSDTVFVVAKAVEGGGPPLAVKRYLASELPAKFTLDESAAMSPDRSLAGAKEAVVSARLSKTGDAIPGLDDRKSESARIKIPASGVRLELR